MTCIIGYAKDSVVYIGGDSAGVLDNNIRVRKDEKVFVKGDFIFGFTSSFRMGQLIRYKLEIPPNPGKDDYEYMCSDFIDAVVTCFNENGYARKDNERLSGGQFLVGYNGQLYNVESDFQVGQVVFPYDACGCGENYALGAMAALEIGGWCPHDKIIVALEITEKLSTGVCGPFVVERLE